ncbi:S-adenosyl-L-methionine-dependent methyltransferase [Zychaea mexicana]|uniref:S-adenosyl-L-methionine-dependent methyltransferase n=1 Tax=Zychaea mexicana TaxID=64656 RepID=UPI0022FF263B|nr:S-adenosyl-L-methionine-dependent methyltransferase [Zychaea mexicana]KAI9494607.1 S-adenosyl-L-methionine-dependent methyltransferase [Zychaea mexicana]
MGPLSRRRRREAQLCRSQKNDQQKDGGPDQSSRRTTRVTVKDNEQFRNYYKSQNILSEEEFEEFYKALQTPLPSTFRITGTRSHALSIQRMIKEVYIPAMQEIKIDGQKVEPPQPLPWYPDNLGWQINASRMVVKRSPEFSKFHKFIVAETEAGNLSRQEAVSMVPPLLMDIQPHQWVLDMCAAPGSKTTQIIEAVHANDQLGELPEGMVVANDADRKRSYLLIHQLKRMQSPCFVATNHDAAHFPGIRITDADGTIEGPLRFDRVLCDVPCSGDGTVRKNEKIWTQWNQGGALELHSTQVQIFLRGAHLTKVGGRIVYSTCSLNPVENEAVVAEVLRKAKGALILRDVSDQLLGLKRKPGLHTWKVMTKDGKHCGSMGDLQDNSNSKQEAQKGKFPKSVFPPDNAEALHLDRCLRIYPHLQNTGGFFVAVFDKVKPMSRSERGSDDSEDTATTSPIVLPTKRSASNNDKGGDNDGGPNKRAAREAPFELVPEGDGEIHQISEFYGLDRAFPRDQFLVRSEGNSKNMYFVSQAVKELLKQSDVHRLNIVMTGTRVFVRQSSAEASSSEGDRMPFRLTWESIPLLNAMLSERRRVQLASDIELQTLLTEAYPKIERFEAQTIAKLESMELGCCVFDYGAIDKPGGAHNNKLTLPVWRGRVSLSLLLNKVDKRALSERLFGIVPESTPEHLRDRSVANQSKDEDRTAESETLP